MLRKRRWAMIGAFIAGILFSTLTQLVAEQISLSTLVTTPAEAVETPDISGAEGYFRVGDVQVCWGNYVPSKNGNWNARNNVFYDSIAFVNDSYNIVAYANTADRYKVVKIYGKFTDHFMTKTYNSGNPLKVKGRYIAMGHWQ